MSNIENLKIPHELLPQDGHFDCGPFLIRSQQFQKLEYSQLMGTSYRQTPVKDLVKACQHQLAEFSSLPTDYEAVLGNGGATMPWGVATCYLTQNRTAHAVFREFGNKFAIETTVAPLLQESRLTSAAPGDLILPDVATDADVYAWPQQEISTGAVASVTCLGDPEQLVLMGVASAAGAVPVDISQTDTYYFLLQKALGVDGGLWSAFLSPAAAACATKITANPEGNRQTPAILNLEKAISNPRKNQTLNTPAIITLELLHSQLCQIQDKLGGLQGAEKWVRESSEAIQTWVKFKNFTTSFIVDSEKHSPVISIIDLSDDTDTTTSIKTPRNNGIVDVNPYRSLGRDQLRIGIFPVINLGDIGALLACLGHTIDRLQTRKGACPNLGIRAEIRTSTS